MLKTIEWTGHAARLLDQTRLPRETVYVDIADERQMWDAIKRLVVRGAPAIGVAAAFGVYLGVRNCETDTLAEFDARLGEVCAYLASSRPTAVNLFWALDRMKRVSAETRLQGSRTEEQMVAKIKARLLAEALAMLEEDKEVCRRIGENGLKLLLEVAEASGKSDEATKRRSDEGKGIRHGGTEARKHEGAEATERDGLDPSSLRRSVASSLSAPIPILTHCNAGALATVAYGTALAPVYVGHERGVRFHVFSDETRPLLQGSRITAAELREAGVPVTVICDNMAASVMSQGKVKAVIVGTDRVAANGDVANKIGTLNVAILARHFGIPFFVAAPTSSIDLSLDTGAKIPIEERNPTEISNGFGKPTAPEGVDFYNPAFDVTPADLVTAIITEHGVARPPYRESLAHVCGR